MTDSEYATINLLANGIHIEVDGYILGQADLRKGYVPYTFAPNIEQYLLVTGDKLQNGMAVLLEDKLMRADPNKLSEDYPARKDGFVPSSYDVRNVEETARWCIVTNLETLRANDEIIQFTGIYADGTMANRSYNKSYKWIVARVDAREICAHCGHTL